MDKYERVLRRAARRHHFLFVRWRAEVGHYLVGYCSGPPVAAVRHWRGDWVVSAGGEELGRRKTARGAVRLVIRTVRRGTLSGG